MKRKKINKKGISWLFIFITSLIVIVHDFYRLTIEPIFTGKLTALTWLGVITFGIALTYLCRSYDQLKKVC